MRYFFNRSRRRPGTDVCLRKHEAFGGLPAELAKRLGAVHSVLEIDLQPERIPAQVDPQVVRHNLPAHRFCLQSPPIAELSKPTH